MQSYLKPENVLIDKDGYTTIVDLGFAKIVLEGSKVGICLYCSFAIDNSNLTNYNYYSPNGDLHYIFKLTLIIADQVSKCQDLWNGQFCIQTPSHISMVLFFYSHV